MNVGLFAYVGKKSVLKFQRNAADKADGKFCFNARRRNVELFPGLKAFAKKGEPRNTAFQFGNFSFGIEGDFYFLLNLPERLAFLLKFPFAKFPFSFERIKKRRLFFGIPLQNSNCVLRLGPLFFKLGNCRRGRPFCKSVVRNIAYFHRAAPLKTVYDFFAVFFQRYYLNALHF